MHRLCSERLGRLSAETVQRPVEQAKCIDWAEASWADQVHRLARQTKCIVTVI